MLDHVGSELDFSNWTLSLYNTHTQKWDVMTNNMCISIVKAHKLAKTLQASNTLVRDTCCYKPINSHLQVCHKHATSLASIWKANIMQASNKPAVLGFFAII